MPVGLFTAMAIEDSAPPMAVIRRGRDLQLGWVSFRKHSIDGTQLLGKTS